MRTWIVRRWWLSPNWVHTFLGPVVASRAYVWLLVSFAVRNSLFWFKDLRGELALIVAYGGYVIVQWRSSGADGAALHQLTASLWQGVVAIGVLLGATFVLTW